VAYCNFDDVEARIGEDDLAALADYDGNGAADADVVARAIESAGALIDSYLGVRYSVPVSGAPPALNTCAVNLAIYFLRLGRDSVTEDARSQYEDDLAWLSLVAAGQVSLGLDERPAASSGAGGVRSESQPRLFGRDNPL